MDIKDIRRAVNETKRFLDAALELERRYNTDPEFKKYFDIVGSRETAACKRASLDLTRALADMRTGRKYYSKQLHRLDP